MNEYEDLIHQHHLELELTDEYKSMIDDMLRQEAEGTAKYITFDEVKSRFGGK